MTPALLRRIGEACYGKDWHAPLAYDLGMGRRVVERMDSGEFEIPPGLIVECRELVTRRREMSQKLLDTYFQRATELLKLDRELNGGAGATPSVPLS